ncbi:MAG: gluconate 2-dehydrogenase subunit 3 family protein [Bacteroidota bacterium]
MNRRSALRRTGLMAGATALTPSLLTLLNACQSEAHLDWQPQFFSDEEARCISSLIDTILPRTDTPGALDVQVDRFIDQVIAQTYNSEAQQHIRSEIAQFNEKCKQLVGSTFADASKEERTRVLQAAEAEAGTFNGAVWGTTVGEQKPVGFYRSIKAMALGAYLSSEKIGKSVLSYDPVPGDYKGCIPVSEVGNRWSL